MFIISLWVSATITPALTALGVDMPIASKINYAARVHYALPDFHSIATSAIAGFKYFGGR